MKFLKQLKKLKKKITMSKILKKIFIQKIFPTLIFLLEREVIID